jgi:hypothetical protein
VSVTDGVNTTSANININLKNLNDNAPTFSTETISFTKNERYWNSGCSLTCPDIGTVVATDADFNAGPNGGDGFEFSYSILSQENANSFEIDSSTGAIRSLDPHIDYETDSNYTLTVQASDGELSDTIDVTVNVNNIDEGPYISSPTNVSINENETIVAVITADDYEGWSSNTPIDMRINYNGGGGNPSSECQWGQESQPQDCEFFALETLSSNTARLTMIAPNFENPQDSNQDNTYNLSIGVTMGYVQCGYHYPYCGQAFDFTVTVNDANDAPYLSGYGGVSFSNITFTGSAPNHTAVAINRSENRLDSNGLVTGYIVTLYGKDEDNDTVSCSISGTDASFFVTQASGSEGCRISIDPYPDYETKSSYSAVLQFSDGTSDSAVDLTVNIIDPEG